jgi:hypothetical protein
MSDQLTDRALYPLSDIVVIGDFPLTSFLPPGQVADVANGIYQAESRSDYDGENIITEFLLIYEQELSLHMPGFPELAVIIAPAGAGRSAIRAKLVMGPDASLTLLEARVALRLPEVLLKDMASGAPAEIVVEGDIEFSENGIRFERLLSATLPPAYLLGTGIAVAATKIRPVLNTEDIEEGIDILGMAFDLLSVTLPLDFISLDDAAEFTLGIQDALIDAQGFTGKLNAKAEDLELPMGGNFQTLPFRFREFQLDIFQNAFISLSLGADIRLNFLEAGAHENWMLFDFQLGTDAMAMNARIENPLVFNLGSNSQKLEIQTLELSGQRDATGFNLQGTCSGNLSLAPIQVALDRVAVSFAHQEGGDQFSFELSDLALGPLGQVDTAVFKLETKKDENGDSHPDLFQIETQIAWQDLNARLHLTDLPEFFPLPPDTAQVSARLSWKESGEMVLSFSTTAENPDHLWRFVPGNYAPEVPEASFIFEATYKDGTRFENADPNAPIEEEDHLNINIASEMAIRLPELPAIPGLDLMDIDPGDETGLIRARLSSAFELGATQAVSVGMAIHNPFTVSLRLPGTQPGQPFIRNALNTVGLQFTAKENSTDEQTIGGEMVLEGEFEFNPLMPLAFPFAAHINTLMAQVGLHRITGKSKMTLGFAQESFDLELHGEFDDFGIDLDIFKLLGAIAPASGGASDNEIDVDFDVGFHLVGFTFAMGTDTDSGTDNAYYFSFKLNVECTMTGLPPTMAAITLSNEEFSFGIENLSIPVTIPKYPMDVEDLSRLVHQNDIWSLDNGTPGKDYLSEIRQQESLLSDQINAAAASESEKFRLRKALTAMQIKRLMLEITMAIHGSVAVAGEDSAKTYQGLVTVDTWIHSTVMNFLHFDTNLILFFPEIKFRIPFDNPGGIAVSGSGKLIGFAEDDPMKALEDYTFSLGLSSQYIFARIESTGAPVPLPSFGTKYDDGTVSISKFMIGYGYTKNSFAFDFAGEVVIPSKLIEDANTSDQIGFGVELPRYNKLAFQLDMMIFTIGKITVAVPVPRFDLDLRSPGAPDFTDLQRCLPYWDGLEVIVKDLIHADMKHLAFSPFFGFSITPNLKFDGDIKLGDDINGLTLILNDLLILFGTYTGSSVITPIPFFAAPDQPYFRNICANLRLLGFEINFNLERPFPSASPLALLEVFGLISNPMMPIDPNGSLANTIRFTLSNAYVKVPDFVLAMFPEATNLVDKRHGFTLNLGTLITMLQTIKGAIDPAMEQTRAFMEDAGQSLENWKNNLPHSFDPWDLAGLLPPELRTLQLDSGHLAGFQASARIVISTEAEARTALKMDDSSPPQTLDLLSLKAGENAVIQYESADNPLYTPTSADDFDTAWQQEGVAGNWTYSTDTISQKGPLNGISCLVFQKAIPENVNLSIRMQTPKNSGGESGLVFSFKDSGHYYLLKISGSDTGGCRIIVQRKKTGRLLPKPLMDKILRTSSNDIHLELICFLQDGVKHLVVNHIMTTRDRYGVSGELRTFKTGLGQATDSTPLENGKVGLYAKNNSDARFTRMKVAALTVTPRDFKVIDGNEFNVNLTESNLSGNRPVGKNEALSLFSGEAFQGFGEDMLDNIPVDRLPHQGTGPGNVFMGARLSVLDSQEFRFLGKLFQDGSFALISEAEARQLALSVLGIPVSIPFEGYGRLIAAGWRQSNRFDGFVEAGGFFTWEPIPKVLQINVGSPVKPATLQLFGDGRFNMSANATILLFDGASRIDGSVDITNTSCEFSGRLRHKIGNSIELDIRGDGGLGKRPKFWFEGQGSIGLFGRKITSVDVSLDENRARFAFSFTSGRLPDFAFLDNSFRISLQLDGSVDINHKTRPAFAFTGEGSLRAFGARIEGYGGARSVVSANPTNDFSEIHMGGRLFWQGREWLQGKIVLNTRTGFYLEGHTRFGLQLSPGQIGGVDVANLFFSINLGGSMTLSPSGKFNFDMNLEWSLGIHLPGNDRQILPLAAGDISIGGDLSTPLNLINLNGFKLFPMDGLNLSLPVPRIKGKGDPVLLVGVKNNKIAINVPQLGTLYLNEKEFVTGLSGGTLPSLTPGTLPNLTPGTLPSLTGGRLPSLNKGNLPSLNINFLQGRFDFSPGKLPSLSAGALPSLNAGTLPSLAKGSLPKLIKGKFPTLKKSAIPLPAYSTAKTFDPNTKPIGIHAQFDVEWDQQTIPIALTTFQSLPVQFGFDTIEKRFFLKIDTKKYSLTGGPM